MDSSSSFSVDRFRRLQEFSHPLFFAGLIILAVSMPLSKFGMSVSQFLIAAGWLLQPNLGSRVRKFFSSKAGLLIASLYILHIIGLIHTSDFSYAFKDLRIKLPLLLLPFLFVTGPALSMKNFRLVLGAVVTGAFVSSLISMMIYWKILDRPVNDIRDISIFISHIRMALICCMSVFILIWFMRDFYHHGKVFAASILILPVFWFAGFIILLENISGILILLSAALLMLIYFLFRSDNKWLKMSFLFLLLLSAFYVYQQYHKLSDSFRIKETYNEVDRSAVTSSGKSYYHDFESKFYENGYPVWAYIREDEMAAVWNQVSELDYYGTDYRGNPLKFTLVRYLTSMGLRKDGDAISRLSAVDVNAIEQGIANIIYTQHGPLFNRLHQVMWEINNFRSGGNPSGHSVMQRLEYWKTAWHIVKRNPVAGVGTGDVPNEFKWQYEKDESILDPKWRLRTHNQYLSIAVAFGFTGLAWFLWVGFYLVRLGFRNRNALFLLFIWTTMISMISEDTLETQAGITFVAFFTSLLLFVNPLNRSVDGIMTQAGRHQL
jgi:hypothetical protein